MEADSWEQLCVYGLVNKEMNKNWKMWAEGTEKNPFIFLSYLFSKLCYIFLFFFFFFKSSLLFNFSKTMMTSVAVCRKAVCCQINISIIKNRQTENPELVTWNAWFFRDSEYITHSQLNYIKTRNTFYYFNQVYQYFLRY